MCGIVYVKRKDKRPAYKAVLKRYRKQKHRGSEGFGYVAVKKGEVVAYNRAPTEHEIVKLMEKEDAEEILFHHRFPTSTPNIEEAAHPLLVENGMLKHQYLIAHNGVIRNTKELKEGHKALDFSYTTEISKGYIALSSKKHYHTESAWNDSESLAIETALAMDGLKKTIDTEGPAAVIGFQTTGAKVVARFFYRNALHPLMFNEDKVMTTITSLGSGTVVPIGAVRVLKQGGGHTEYGGEHWSKHISTPLGTAAYRYGKERWNPATKTYERETTPLALPAAHQGRHQNHKTHMGFGHFGSPFDDDRDDIRFDYNPRENVAKGRSIAEILGDIESIEDTMRNKEAENIMVGMSIDQLWDEHEKAVGIEKDIKDSVKSIDKLAEDMILNEEMYRRREQLQQHLARVVKYQKDLFDELMDRDTAVPILDERLLK